MEGGSGEERGEDSCGGCGEDGQMDSVVDSAVDDGRDSSLGGSIVES